jgi:hypothetical protein
MKSLKFTYLAIAIGIAFPLAAKAQDQVIPGQKQFTGALGVVEDFGLALANKSVAGTNDSMNDLDKEAKLNSGDLTPEKAVEIQKQNFDARLAMQNKINDTLQKIQEKRDTASQYIASHPGDTRAVDAAKQLANAYNQVAEMGNQNSDKMYLGRAFLENQKVQNLPPVPNHIDKLPIPSAMPSGLEMQQLNDANKPPVTSDADKPLGPPTLQEDLNASYKTEDGLNKLIPLAQRYAALTAKNAQANPDDPVLQADAENAQADVDKLLAMQKNNNSRITSDLGQKYPPEETKPDAQSETKSDAKSGDHTPDYPTGNDPIADLMSLGGSVVAMSSDQGDESTQKFIDSINGDSGNKVASGDSTGQVRDVARDNAKDAARDAARDAASAVRDSARPSTDGMRNCPPGH